MPRLLYQAYRNAQSWIPDRTRSVLMIKYDMSERKGAEDCRSNVFLLKVRQFDLSRAGAVMFGHRHFCEPKVKLVTAPTLQHNSLPSPPISSTLSVMRQNP
jgi:hypothetical protein